MEKLKLAYTILVIVFVIVAATLNRRRRKLQRKMCCYLASDESKPQCSFKLVLADNSYSLFKHLNKTEDSNSHPYEKEISNLLENSEIEDLRFVNGEMNMVLKGNYVWVDTEEQLRHLLEVLSKETVFAVDTEQHSLRSFLGFTALMQISTQAKDYLVDTIALHDVVGMLHPVFANPKICKVFHGADNDVIWLQRDFHIYVVNLFDTAKACEVLSKPHRSLAYLLEAYCGVATNKVLQREDWRLRPLSEEMIQYARADTHYLLYIADSMASELKAQYTGKPDLPNDKFHFLLEARRLSNRICLKRYTKEVPGNSAASSILSRYLNGSYKFETKELVGWWCMWRDTMARVHDESSKYVLSDEAIVALALKAPKTEAEIYDTISEADSNSLLPSPSPVVLSHLENICCYLNNNLDDVIQKHLGPSGSCPLSIYNYALLLLKKSELIQVSNAKQNGVEIIKTFGRKKKEFQHPKSQGYHNCRIYTSDGQLLCYTYPKRLGWYIRQNLAKVVDNEEGQAIMLCFEPKCVIRQVHAKKNICVGCGEGEKECFRFRIVPSYYGKHFPEHSRNIDPHNVVLVCGDCEQIAICARDKLNSQICDEFGVPHRIPAAADYGYGGGRRSGEELKENWELRKAAFTLLYRGLNLPAERKEKLTQEVMKFYGGREVSEEDLKRVLLIGMTPNDKARLEKKYGTFIEGEPGRVLPNEKDVVDHILKEYGKDGLREFRQRWRQMFVEALQPRFLPHAWGVDRT